MPKKIIILDPNGVEVARMANRGFENAKNAQQHWEDAVASACFDLQILLKRENPKLGTYTVTVKEVE